MGKETTAKATKADNPELAGAGDQAPETEAHRVVPLQVSRWQLGEFLNARHSVSPAAGTPFDDLLRPEFWANIVRLKPGDIIEVRPEDQSYYAELYVIRRDRNAASVCVIREPVKLEPAYKPLPGAVKYAIEFAGPIGQWRVRRLSDNAVMKDRCGTENDARRWLSDYERVVAA